MAEKRMFAKKIVYSDAFLDLPLSSQALYFQLVMMADDNGIVNNAKSTCRGLNISAHNITNLIDSNFLDIFNQDAYNITHWNVHNENSLNVKKRISYKYRKWRENVLIRDNYTCMDCGDKEKVMHVHHIKPFATNENLRYEMDNGITLCPSCHRYRHKEG